MRISFPKHALIGVILYMEKYEVAKWRINLMHFHVMQLIRLTIR